MRARNFRLKSEWTQSAPGPRGPSSFLCAHPPSPRGHDSRVAAHLFQVSPDSICVFDILSGRTLVLLLAKVFWVSPLSLLWPSSTLPWVAPSFLLSSSFAPLPLGMRISLHGAMGVRVLIFVDFAYRLTLKFPKAPGPFGDRGEWPWRAHRWIAPRWPGCTSFLQVPVQFAVPGAAGHNRWGVSETSLPANTQGRTRDAALNVVSFKPERVFKVIAHVTDWEHAETVRRRCLRTVGGIALHAECTGPREHVGESAPGDPLA